MNLTQHQATLDQINDGVKDLPPEVKNQLASLLTFDDLPSREEIHQRAELIAEIAAITATDLASEGLDDDAANAAGDPVGVKAMIGGAPWLMPSLQDSLSIRGIESVYAFSVREIAEIAEADGSVVKKAVFRHRGFVPYV